MIRAGRNIRPLVFAVVCGLVIMAMSASCESRKELASNSSGGKVIRFSGDIERIVSRSCFECHGDKAREAGLDLRSVDRMLAGGESGPAVVPGHPGRSLLLDMLHDEHMPPEGELLTAGEIERLRMWIASGARP